MSSKKINNGNVAPWKVTHYRYISDRFLYQIHCTIDREFLSSQIDKEFYLCKRL
nr:MAG TPA: hypothetical protein [Caudoviricetes sp.]